MKIDNLILFILFILFLGWAFGMCGCGDDDILNQIPSEEPVVGEEVVVTLPDGEEIPAEVVEAPDGSGPTVEDPEVDCPEEYVIADMVILDCGENMALVAIGQGCLKSLQILEGDEAKEWCD